MSLKIKKKELTAHYIYYSDIFAEKKFGVVLI